MDEPNETVEGDAVAYSQDEFPIINSKGIHMSTGLLRPAVGRRIFRQLSLLALLGASALAAAAPVQLARSGAGGVDQRPAGQATGGQELAPSPLADNPIPFVAAGPAMGGSSVSSRVPSSVLAGAGLNHHDQRTADNGNQFSLEPPDQGLCVGNGFVVEAVNNAIRVRSARTNQPVSGVTALNRFYGFASEINRSAAPGEPVFGPFLSDPKCVYDVDTRRFIVTELGAVQDPFTGDFTGQTFVAIAVSTTSDPTKPFAVFLLDTTNDGSNGITHTDCPCLGDQPLIGLDKNGLYISTNEFSLVTGGFNGAQLYGISKQKLAAAASGAAIPIPVGIVNAGALATPDAGGIWYSVQPASYTPNDRDDEYDSDNGVQRGVEYFLSALEFFGTGDTRIAVWALTNTNSLQSASPNLGVQNKVISTEFYVGPPSMKQKGSDGLVQSNDDRMNQVKKYHNTLFAGLNTAITSAGGQQTAGIAYFGVKPRWHGHTLDGRLVNEGYVSVNGNNVAYPSIALNGDGNGMLAFSLMGPDYYPSAAYIRFNSGQGAHGQVVIAAAGVAPYASFGVIPGVSDGRWGDYSACSDEHNQLWAAAEMVPVTSFGAASNGGLANWGTAVWRFTPDD